MVPKEPEPKKLSKGEQLMPYHFVKVKIPPHMMRMYKRWTIPPKMEYNYTSWDDIPLMDNITKASITWSSPVNTVFSGNVFFTFSLEMQNFIVGLIISEPNKVIEVSSAAPYTVGRVGPCAVQNAGPDKEPKAQPPQKLKEIVTINLESQPPSDVPREPNRTPSGSSGLKMVPIQSLTNPTKPELPKVQLPITKPNNGDKPVINQTEAEMMRILKELEKANPSTTYNKELKAQLNRPAMNHREADIVRILSEMYGITYNSMHQILIEQQKTLTSSMPNTTELKAQLKKPVANQAEAKMVRIAHEMCYKRHLSVPKSQAGPRFDHRQIVIPKTAVESHKMPTPLQVGPRLNPDPKQQQNIVQKPNPIRPNPMRPMWNQIRHPQRSPIEGHNPIGSKPEKPKISPRPCTSPPRPVRPHARLGVPISHVNSINNPRVTPTVSLKTLYLNKSIAEMPKQNEREKLPHQSDLDSVSGICFSV